MTEEERKLIKEMIAKRIVKVEKKSLTTKK